MRNRKARKQNAKKRVERCGKLVVFEGLDASGKHTQCVLLLKKLRSLGLRTAFYAFPAYATKFGKIIKKYLAGGFGSKNALPPQAIALLYALDRAQFREKIARDLKRGAIVVCDRYVQSNLYQAAKLPRAARAEFEAWAERLESGMPRADCVVFLDVPLAHGRKLLKKRGRAIDVHEADVSYLNEVRHEYLKEAKKAKKNSEWRVVECAKRGVLLSRVEIAARVWSQLKKLF